MYAEMPEVNHRLPVDSEHVMVAFRLPFALRSELDLELPV